MAKSKKRRSVNNQRLELFFTTLRDELSTLSPRVEAGEFAVKRLSERARKRAKLSGDKLTEKAKRAFLDLNSWVQEREVNLPAQVLADARHYIITVLERYTSRLNSLAIQESLDMEALFDMWRFGPGTSFGVEGTHTAQKIVQDMTATVDAEQLVHELRRKNAYLSGFDALNQRIGCRIVHGSRLSTVPKNEDTERTIAIEPLGNMALQLAAGTYLQGALAMIGLDITNQQDKNNLMAKWASETGRLATIDLKSASDMVSITLVRALMPKSWCDLLERIRSKWIEIKVGNTTSIEELHMISTMGNGFTFPLMTLIITSLIYGMRAQKPRTPNLFIDWEHTAVYGDDIIIPVEEYDELTSLLSMAGLVVNHDKSFKDGPFRESCGGDYFLGVDVTPFYVKSLRTNAEVYVAINQVLEWSARHYYLVRTFLLLESFVDGPTFFVPEWHNPDEGVLTAAIRGRYKFLSTLLPQCELALGDPGMKTPGEYFLCMLAVGGYVNNSNVNRQGIYPNDIRGDGTYKWITREGDPPGRACTNLGPDKVLFSPRTDNVRKKVRRARIPEGYESGWDPLKRSQLVSDRVSDLINLTR